MRLANEGIAGLPTVWTAWRPSGAGGRCFSGRLEAAWVARCRAALALAFALAAAPFRQRRPPPGAGAVAGPVAGEGGVELGEAEGDGSSSTSSFAFSLPSLVVNVSEADPPASFVCRSNFSSSPSILCSESEQKKMAEPKRNVLSLSWFQLNSAQFKTISNKFNSKDYSIQNCFKKIQFNRLFNSKHYKITHIKSHIV